jgi:hypothetical protein
MLACVCLCVCLLPQMGTYRCRHTHIHIYTCLRACVCALVCVCVCVLPQMGQVAAAMPCAYRLRSSLVCRISGGCSRPWPRNRNRATCSIHTPHSIAMCSMQRATQTMCDTQHATQTTCNVQHATAAPPCSDYRLRTALWCVRAAVRLRRAGHATAAPTGRRCNGRCNGQCNGRCTGRCNRQCNGRMTGNVTVDAPSDNGHDAGRARRCGAVRCVQARSWTRTTRRWPSPTATCAAGYPAGPTPRRMRLPTPRAPRPAACGYLPRGPHAPPHAATYPAGPTPRRMLPRAAHSGFHRDDAGCFGTGRTALAGQVGLADGQGPAGVGGRTAQAHQVLSERSDRARRSKRRRDHVPTHRPQVQVKSQKHKIQWAHPCMLLPARTGLAPLPHLCRFSVSPGPIFVGSPLLISPTWLGIRVALCRGQ